MALKFGVPLCLKKVFLECFLGVLDPQNMVNRCKVGVTDPSEKILKS